MRMGRAVSCITRSRSRCGRETGGAAARARRGGAGYAGPGAWPRGRGGGLHRRPQVIRVALRRRAPHAWRPSRRLRRRLKTSPTAGVGAPAMASRADTDSKPCRRATPAASTSRRRPGRVPAASRPRGTRPPRPHGGTGLGHVTCGRVGGRARAEPMSGWGPQSLARAGPTNTRVPGRRRCGATRQAAGVSGEPSRQSRAGPVLRSAASRQRLSRHPPCGALGGGLSGRRRGDGRRRGSGVFELVEEVRGAVSWNPDQAFYVFRRL